MGMRFTNLLLNCNRRYVFYFHFMPRRGAVCAGVTRASYGTHLLDHLAADGAGLTGGQVAVVTLLQIDADFP